MTHRSLVWLSPMILVAALATGATAHPQAQTLCGPAAAIITTPQQQQSLITTIQAAPRPLGWTARRPSPRRPTIVYENGDAFVLVPLEDHMARHQKAGGGGAPLPREATPDPGSMTAMSEADLPMSLFVHNRKYLTPTRSQGGRGLCHVFAAAAMIESLCKRRLMRQGVPEEKAEIDLSEEWMGYWSMKSTGEREGNELLDGDGGFSNLDLEEVLRKPWQLEAYLPYNPISWPEEDPAVHTWCTSHYRARGVAYWECWAHVDRGDDLPLSTRHFNGFVSPDGPLPNIKVRDIVLDADHGTCLETAKQCIDDGRTACLSLAWPSSKAWNGTMLHVPPDYPFDLRDKVVNEEALTGREQAEWDDWYIAGHVVQIFGYGKRGTEAEGIWLVKNSHGLGSGFDGILYLTENFIKLSWPDVCHARLTSTTLEDLDRFAETLKASEPKAPSGEGHIKRTRE